jgi:uncharacterized protein YecT (DUF1311 family)
MTKLTFTGLLLILLNFSAFGQEKEVDLHPIEKKLEDCLATDSNQTTAGMTNCVYSAVDEWDKELNKYYQILMDVMSATGKENLKISQRKWIEYRDKEFRFISTFYNGEMQGTMWIVVAADHRMSIVRDRAIELKGYYDLLTFK